MNEKGNIAVQISYENSRGQCEKEKCRNQFSRGGGRVERRVRQIASDTNKEESF